MNLGERLSFFGVVRLIHGVAKAVSALASVVRRRRESSTSSRRTERQSAKFQFL
jgi:hypothetical protein